MPAPAAIALLLLLLLSPAAPAAPARAGEVDVSFPLGEHYRVGRCLPVRVTAKGIGGGSVLVGGPGAVPVRWKPAAGGQGGAVLPLLPVEPLEALTYVFGREPGEGRDAPQRFRALAPGERLVASTLEDGENEPLAAELFPGREIISAPLDPADPLPGPALAWGALDAVLLDPSAAARVTERQVATLLAAGTAVAVRTDARPGGGWPWERRGPWWVARFEPAGPRELIEPDAYAPVSARDLGWRPAFRRTLVLACAAFAVAALGASLWRSRRAWIAVAAVSVLACGALVLWRSRQAPGGAAIGGVCVRSPGWEQRDEWSYRVALATGEDVQPLPDAPAGVTRPVFASARHAAAVELRLECAPDGTPLAYHARLHRGQVLAFLTRSVIPAPSPSGDAPPPPPAPAAASPMAALAQSSYLSPAAGTRIVGVRRDPAYAAAPPAAERWPQVVLDRGAPHSAALTPAPAAATAPAAPPR